MIVDGWFDWAERHELDYHRLIMHGGKLISHQPNAMEIVVCHSLEGYTSSGYWAFEDPNRRVTGWHATVLRGGEVIQHAPLYARLAHGNAANPHGPGIESEGVFSQPLTGSQVRSWLRILRDIETWQERPYTRRNGRLKEHREYGPTACPSGRYAPLYVALDEPQEVDMTPEQVREIVREMVRNKEIQDVRLREAMQARVEEASEAVKILASAFDPDTVPGEGDV